MAPDKKNAARLGAHVVFADESGFMLMPHVVRTWAPRGQTPVHRHPYRRAKVSAISGVSVSPILQRLNLFCQLYPSNITQEEVLVFLRTLLRHLPGQLIVLLDNAQPHRGRLVRDLLTHCPRLQIEYFPSYAPELNPDEGVWSQAKRMLANGCPANATHLMRDVARAIAIIGRSPDRLRACIRHSHLPPFLR